MTMNFLLAAGVIALVALSITFGRAARALLRIIAKLEPVQDPEGLEALWGSLEAFEKRTLNAIAELRLAVSDGIARVDRADKRIQKTVTSARRQLREAGIEHAGIEAEFAELPASDEGGGEDQGVLPLQAPVERDGPSGIPGISRSELAAMREA